MSARNISFAASGRATGLSSRKSRRSPPRPLIVSTSARTSSTGACGNSAGRTSAPRSIRTGADSAREHDRPVEVHSVEPALLERGPLEERQLLVVDARQILHGVPLARAIDAARAAGREVGKHIRPHELASPATTASACASESSGVSVTQVPPSTTFLPRAR